MSTFGQLLQKSTTCFCCC